jgi:hypothetical protein
VVGKLASAVLGQDIPDLEDTLTTVAALVQDYVFFTHVAVVHYLQQHSQPTVRLRDF